MHKYRGSSQDLHKLESEINLRRPDTREYGLIRDSSSRYMLGFEDQQDFPKRFTFRDLKSVSILSSNAAANKRQSGNDQDLISAEVGTLPYEDIDQCYPKDHQSSGSSLHVKR